MFIYSPCNGASWFKLRIPEGIYEIDATSNTIHHEMEKRGHHDPINEEYYINISANSNSRKSVLILEDDYQVDFNHQNSIAKVFGFTNAKYTRGFHESKMWSIPSEYTVFREWFDKKHYLLLFSES